MSHTPLPWTFGGTGSWEVYAPDGEGICTVHAAEEWQDGLLDVKHERKIAEANGQLIVHAVNSHGALLAACEKWCGRVHRLEYMGEN